MSRIAIPGIEPRGKQPEFYRLCEDPGAEEIWFDGSIRSGKSQACCRKIAAWAITYRPCTYLVMRRHYQELEDSTKKVMLWGDGDLPPALPVQLWKGGLRGYQDKRNRVVLINGAEILFRNAEDPKKAQDIIKNITLGGAFVDQVEEFDDAEYEELIETLCGRLSDPRGPRKILFASNPGPETHWAHARAVDPATRLPSVRYLHTTLLDNKDQLPSNYVRKMNRRRRTRPAWFRQYILGEWGAFGGKRFPGFARDKHVIAPFDLPRTWEFSEGLDYGYAHPFAYVLHAVAPCGHNFIVAEHWETYRPVSWHAKRIKEIRREFHVSPVDSWLSPDAFGATRGEFECPAYELTDYGIDCAQAQTERRGGWNRIEELLEEHIGFGPDGERVPVDELGRPTGDEGTCSCPAGAGPRLRIFEGCEHVVKEIPSLKVKLGTGGEDVEKKDDDAADAVRYVLASRPEYYDEKAEEEEEKVVDLRKERYRRRMERRKAAQRGSIASQGL